MPRHLIDITDLTVEEIDALIATAENILDCPDRYQNLCTHKQLATLFFEPSTRTRLSFESAMLSLGGSVLGFAAADSSSAAKGETVGDTVHTVSCYADIIAMRHPKEGAPLAASFVSEVPVINAGDGGHNHPTQTLTDLITIHREKGRLNDFTIGFCGDLKFGRTVHSLVNALSRYENVRYVFISPLELKLPRYVSADNFSGVRHARSGYSLYDTGTEGALFQRRRLPASERQLYSHAGETLDGKSGFVDSPPAAPRQ